MKAIEERQENGRKGGIKSSQMRTLTHKNNNLFQGILESAHASYKPEAINKKTSNHFWKTKKIFLEPSQPLPDHQLPFTKPMEVDEEYWKKRLLWANRDGIWPSDWGPAPGKKGCLVPEKLLQETNLQPFE